MDVNRVTFLITGGAGRVICAIPALEEYITRNPDKDVKILIPGWSSLYYSHPLLQSRTYDLNMKGAFDLVVKDSILIHPEPYHDYEYYNNKISLSIAFWKIILPDVDSKHSYLIPKLYLHSNEIKTTKKLIEEAKKKYSKKKFMVFQPYGSTATLLDGEVYDSSGRSLNRRTFNTLATELAKDFVVLYMGDLSLVNGIHDSVLLTAKDIPGADLRFFMSMISCSDYFVGVDSVGQHMARAFHVPGTIIMGSTFEKNVTYQGFFNIIRREGFTPNYNPIRIADSDFVDRLNDGIMDFDIVETVKIVDNIKGHINEG